MFMIKKLFFSLSFFVSISIYGQETIIGKIKAIDGRAVEYATISVDSTFTLSDAAGNFSLLLPKGHTQDLKVTHISYKPLVIPRSKYISGNINITLEEAVNELTNITITNKKNKLKAISGKGIRIPGGDACFRNEHDGVKEIGPIVKADKDFTIESINLKILSNTYKKCILRVILYEIKGKKLTPIQTKPLYAEAKQSDNQYSLSFIPQQIICLKKGHRYFAGLTIVESSKKGELHIPAHLHSGLGHNTLTGNTKKIPASIGLKILGSYN